MSEAAPPTERGFAPPPLVLRTGLAVAAMALSIMGLCLAPLALVGLTLGIFTLLKANERPDVHGGKRMAIAGIVVGGFALFIWGFLITILANDVGEARQTTLRYESGEQLHSIGTALRAYSEQYDTSLPEFGTNIVQRLANEAPAELFASPIVGRGSTTVSYLYCAGLDGTNPNAVLMFENPAINPRGINVLYQDGHIEFIRAADIPTTLAGVQNVQTTDGQPFTVQLPK